jgi:hypothetical protein
LRRRDDRDIAQTQQQTESRRRGRRANTGIGGGKNGLPADTFTTPRCESHQIACSGLMAECEYAAARGRFLGQFLAGKDRRPVRC